VVNQLAKQTLIDMTLKGKMSKMSVMDQIQTWYMNMRRAVTKKEV